MNIEQLYDILGGPTKIAKLCGISVPAVSQWRTTGIPVDRLVCLAAQIEHQTEGKISRKELFPDQWKFIWPELH